MKMTFVNTKDNGYLCWFPGPVIKAEVGQIIQVTFYNNASVPLSIHPHGLLYNKSNEGSFYRTPGGGKYHRATQAQARQTAMQCLRENQTPLKSVGSCLSPSPQICALTGAEGVLWAKVAQCDQDTVLDLRGLPG